MRPDVGQPQRPRVADQLAEHAVAARRLAERAARLVVDPDGDEALQPRRGARSSTPSAA